MENTLAGGEGFEGWASSVNPGVGEYSEAADAER